MEVHRDWAPIGADHFYNLVRTGFYDDSRFYRVRAGFIVQFGLPEIPAVSAIWNDRAMPDDPVVASNDKGLDDQGFAPIGRIVEGMDVVEQLYAEYDESAGGGMRGAMNASDRRSSGDTVM